LDRLKAWQIAAVLAIVALALRAWDFGNPVIHVDEQYYLLVGDRLLHGAVPYVDIWDRKPIGLFLIYAAMRLLPGDGVIAYQLVASVFATTTAYLVWRAALRTGASRTGALAAGTAYLIWLPLLGGRGGQSPVFYNLFVAGAALIALHLPVRARAGAKRAIVAWGTLACLLGGLAIQTKYTPAIEGAFIGCVHLWYLRRAGTGWMGLAGAALLWMVAGLAPTVAAGAYYWSLGSTAFEAFWFANVDSIFLRSGYPADQLAMRLLGIVATLSPLILSAAMAWGWRTRTERREEALVGFGWLAAAGGGFLMIGTFFDHYALPLVAPLAIVAARALGRSSRLLIATLALGLLLNVVERGIKNNDGRGAYAVAALVKANSDHGCPYVFIGDTITYELSGACLPTRYAFPNLLAYTTEQGATGIDEEAEARRVLAARPPVIVTSTRRLAIWNPGSLAALKAALPGYRVIYSVPRADYRTLVYLRRDLPARGVAAMTGTPPPPQ
jgi:hypothetical protein